MPPNPIVPALIDIEAQTNIPAHPSPLHPPNWPGGVQEALLTNVGAAQANAASPAPHDDWLIPSTIAAFTKTGSGRPMPSKERCFYLVIGEREINSYMNNGYCFGVEEAAVLDAEPRVAKQQQTQFILKCIGRLEFVKPKFEELPSDNETTTST